MTESFWNSADDTMETLTHIFVAPFCRAIAEVIGGRLAYYSEHKRTVGILKC